MIEINYLSLFYHISITGWGESVGRVRHPVIENVFNVIQINDLSCLYHVSITGTFITGGHLRPSGRTLLSRELRHVFLMFWGLPLSGGECKCCTACWACHTLHISKDLTTSKLASRDSRMVWYRLYLRITVPFLKPICLLKPPLKPVSNYRCKPV